jgi:hypothetical protein
MQVIKSASQNHTTQEQNILKLLDDFFSLNSIEKCDEEVWSLVTTYFSVPDGELPLARYRASTVHFCHNVLLLLKDLSASCQSHANKSQLRVSNN